MLNKKWLVRTYIQPTQNSTRKPGLGRLVCDYVKNQIKNLKLNNYHGVLWKLTHPDGWK